MATLYQDFKNILKYILPMPARSQNREFNSIKANIQKQAEISNKLQKDVYSLSDKINALQNRLETQQQQAIENARLEAKKSEELLKKEIQQLADNLSKFANTENKNIDYLKKAADEGRRYASEAVWAEIFNNTVKGSTWGEEVPYSPGRWAVGYPYLYVMYRVLNKARPKKILELGLGQSTRMIGQYAATHEGVKHTIVEHDEEWIDFCRNDFSLSPNSQILRLDREFIPYKEAETVRVFKGFKENFEGKKFDFISIDAPLGSDMKEYSRIDVLLLMPDILSENFVIMIDDLGRKQEQNTANEMIEVLKNNNIPFKTGKYSGKKDCMVICAEHLGFFATM